MKIWLGQPGNKVLDNLWAGSNTAEYGPPNFISLMISPLATSFGATGICEGLIFSFPLEKMKRSHSKLCVGVVEKMTFLRNI